MKIYKLFTPLVLVLTFGISSCTKDDTPESNPLNTELTTAELDMLSHMMEEEKLAYDVYITLYTMYETPIFNNISKSEQSHMDAVEALIEKYNIENTASTTFGVFNHPDFQELYDALIESGSQSLVDALKVGATIEDVDIYDLDDYLSKTENADIISVFEFLNCGSFNHLNGFINQLDLQNAEYAPQFISQERFDEILDAGHSACSSYSI